MSKLCFGQIFKGEGSHALVRTDFGVFDWNVFDCFLRVRRFPINDIVMTPFIGAAYALHICASVWNLVGRYLPKDDWSACRACVVLREVRADCSTMLLGTLPIDD
jgi:hypothetical protein